MNRFSINTLFIAVFIFLFTHCTQSYTAKSICGNNISIDSTIQPDSVMCQAILPYRKSLDEKMNRVIGVSSKILDSNFPESPLSNFIADLIQKRAQEYLSEKGADSLQLLTLINIRGLRAPLPKGDVTVSNIFEIMPFENEIIILTLTGDSILSLFNFLEKNNGEGISGARVVFSDTTEDQILINNKKLKKGQHYFLATSDYLSNGGGHFNMLTNPIHSEKIGCKVRKAIIDYIEDLNQSNNIIVSRSDGRIVFE